MRRWSKVLAVSGMSAALCAGSLVSAFARAASDDGYTYAGDVVGYVTFSELTEPIYVNWDVICDFIGMYYSGAYGLDNYYVSVTTCAEWGSGYKSSLCLSDGTYIGDKYSEAATEYVEVTAEMAEDLNSIADAWGWGSAFAKDKPADTGYIAFAFALEETASDSTDDTEASTDDTEASTDDTEASTDDTEASTDDTEASEESESSDVYVNDDGYSDAYSVLGSVAFEDLDTPVYVNWDVACYLFEYYYGSGSRYSVSGLASYGDAYKNVLCDAEGNYIVDKYPEASGNYVQVTAEMAEDLNEIAWQWWWEDHETGYLALAFVLSDSEEESITGESDAEESSAEESSAEESSAVDSVSSNDTTKAGVISSNDTGDFATMVGLVSFAACALAVIAVSSGKKKEA